MEKNQLGKIKMEKNLDTFIGLIKEQFMYGGKKYALQSTRESTDELFDRYGFKWFLGIIDKYCFRFKNIKREKDLLKIATYLFLLWIKRGYHIDKKRKVPIDTNLENKKENFPKFIKIVHDRKNEANHSYFLKHTATISRILKDDVNIINYISDTLKDFAKDGWMSIWEEKLILLFYGAYFIWNRNFSDKPGQDTDINNKEDNK